MLLINNLTVKVKEKLVLRKVSLRIESGEVHAIMGPNGSGKSTLSLTIAGDKNCNIVEGAITFKGLNLLKLNPEKRAKEGIFISFQNSIEIPGVSNQTFLKTSVNEIRKYQNRSVMNHFDFTNLVHSKMRLLKIPKDLLTRSVNVGFSGGERKRNDILHMLMLEPDFCLLDEIDSGLDIDSLKVISNGINSIRNRNRSFLIITHHKNILDYIKPDRIHIFYKGRIAKSGNLELVYKLEEKGYEQILY